VPCDIKCFSYIQGNRRRGHIVIEGQGRVFLKTQALKLRAMTCMKAELVSIQYGISSNMPLGTY